MGTPRDRTPPRCSTCGSSTGPANRWPPGFAHYLHRVRSCVRPGSPACQLRTTAPSRSWRPWPPTPPSRWPSSSASWSPGPRRCWPSACTRLADTGNQALLLLGGKRAKKVADDRPPLRLRPGALLLGLRGRRRAVHAGLGVRDLRGHPQDPAPPSRRRRIWWPYGGAGLRRSWSRGFSFRTAVQQARRGRSRPVVVDHVHPQRQGARAAGGDAGGLPAALCRPGHRHGRHHRRRTSPGYAEWDGIGTVAIGVLLGDHRHRPGGGDEVAAHRRVGDPEGHRGHPGRHRVRPGVRCGSSTCAPEHIGPEELLVGAKVELDHTLTFPEVAEPRSNRIERNVRRPGRPSPGSCTSSPTSPTTRRADAGASTSTSPATTCPRGRARLCAEAREAGTGLGVAVIPTSRMVRPLAP